MPNAAVIQFPRVAKLICLKQKLLKFESAQIQLHLEEYFKLKDGLYKRQSSSCYEKAGLGRALTNILARAALFIDEIDSQDFLYAAHRFQDEPNEFIWLSCLIDSLTKKKADETQKKLDLGTVDINLVLSVMLCAGINSLDSIEELFVTNQSH